MAFSIRQRTAAVNGVDLVVHESGDHGAPLIMLTHGFPETAHSWPHQMIPLAEAGYHVIASDQRGYGRSSVPKMSTHTAQLICLLIFCTSPNRLVTRKQFMSVTTGEHCCYGICVVCILNECVRGLQSVFRSPIGQWPLLN